jgi:hypothetical protein
MFGRGVSHRRLLSFEIQDTPPSTQAPERERRRRHQRIFKLANPINTKITVMIQKRTITFGSGQPLSSK